MFVKHMPIYLGFTNLNFVYFGQYRPLSVIFKFLESQRNQHNIK